MCGWVPCFSDQILGGRHSERQRELDIDILENTKREEGTRDDRAATKSTPQHLE